MHVQILVAILMTIACENARGTTDEAPTIVIVHGAWGGAHHWKQVADAITAETGLVVRRASLTGQGERVHLQSKSVNLDTHIRDVVNLIEFDDLSRVILIGHSYGGVVISGVADRIPHRISKLLYLDAHVLDDGETFFSHHPEDEKRLTQRANEAGQGWLIPVDWKNDMGDVPHPLATLTQPIKLTNPAREKIPATYWLFTDGSDAESDSRYRHYQRSVQRGWQVKTFTWDHNPQRTHPKEVVREIRSAIKSPVQ